MENRGWIVINIFEHDLKNKEKKLNILNEIKSIQEKRRLEHKNAIKNSFNKGNLFIKSYAKEDRKIEWTQVSNVLRHNSLNKNILKIETTLGNVSVTEDHSLFSYNDNKEIKGKDIKVGDDLLCCIDNKPDKVIVNKIEKVEKLNYTYDLSVPKNENFLLKTGILAHNSYSVSGVSLDIDKSSKYESLKNNYIQEYDKIRDLAKSSIKIIKGLQQPRFGIGISSALGPYSRPGVQSRRNYISGF